jgi:poly [ADP-ribose] polymerase
MKEVKLVYENVAENSHKYYYMKQISPIFFEVVYGRIGSSGAKVTYNMSLWESKYREKIRKGYIDVTIPSEDEKLKKLLNIIDSELI